MTKISNWIIIRADAGTNMGVGHVMRCFALAEWAINAGFRPILLTKTDNLFVNGVAESKGIEIFRLENIGTPSELPYEHSKWLNGSELEDAIISREAIIHYINEYKTAPSLIIVDHYALALPWEEKLLDLAPILVIDDLSDRPHNCRWLIDQTYGKSSRDYKSLVPEYCQLYIGPKYALLRKEFSDKAALLTRKLPQVEINLLITLGGIDKDNYTLNLLKLIEQSDKFGLFRISVVTSSANPNLLQLTEVIHKMEDTQLLVDVTNMAELMINHDICIGAAGTTTWERCALALPFISISIADNQQFILENLSKDKLTYSLGHADNIKLSMLNDGFSYLLASNEKYKSIAKNIQKLCDGLGGQRIIATISEYLKIKTETCILIRKATEADAKILLSWANDINVRKNAFNSNVIDYDSHIVWLNRKLTSPDSYIYIGSVNNIPMGQVRIDKEGNYDYSIDIHLNPIYQGKGLGSQLLTKALVTISNELQFAKRAIIRAEIFTTNIASQKMFIKCGFKKVSRKTIDNKLCDVFNFEIGDE